MVAVRVGMGQGTVASPVFRWGVGVHYFGQLTHRRQPGEQSVGQPGFRVGLADVGKWEQAVGAPAGLAGGLRKPLVELPSLAAGHMGHKPIENGAACLVHVKAEVQVQPKKASALGHAKSVCPLQPAWADVVIPAAAVTQERCRSRVASRPNPTTGAPVVEYIT